MIRVGLIGLQRSAVGEAAVEQQVVGALQPRPGLAHFKAQDARHNRRTSPQQARRLGHARGLVFALVQLPHDHVVQGHQKASSGNSAQVWSRLLTTWSQALILGSS